MEPLVFATSNPNKIREVSLLLPPDFKVLGLTDIGCHEDIPETQPTIEGNAIQKAQYVYDHYQKDCFAEDTGLQVEALDGAPGVYSARYAGPQRNSEDNMKKLLLALEGQNNRNAQFKTVVALIIKGKIMTFEGIIKGKIIPSKRGQGGFGYDPLFLPDGYKLTFAEMEDAEKNQISHRARAIKKLILHLKNQTEY